MTTLQNLLHACAADESALLEEIALGNTVYGKCKRD
jgi:hypothetical protein